ncbi:MAG: AlpA family transcriptional regulator [Magnetococcales bacterium]|nr:AlpA family transcriptional regulator [Magnetococcales bacterium]
MAEVSFDKILRRPEVSSITGLGRSSLYDYIRKGNFPPPVKLGPRNVGWRSSDVTNWLATRQPVAG